MKKQIDRSKQFVICIDNSEYPASLELHKIYTVLPDGKAAEDDLIRVVDESGEDYLYSAKRFVSVELPIQVRQSIIRKVRETTKLARTLHSTRRAQRKSKSRKISRAARR
jgi:hypothetical protein